MTDDVKDRVVVSGANGQATDVMATSRGKATYARVLKQSATHTHAKSAVKWKREFTD